MSAPAARAWLTPGQAAALLGVDKSWLLRALRLDLPCESISLRGIGFVTRSPPRWPGRRKHRQTIRIDASSVIAAAPEPIPTQAELTTDELAEWLGVASATIKRLRLRGQIVATRRDPLSSTFIFSRRAILAFLTDHAIND